MVGMCDACVCEWNSTQGVLSALTGTDVSPLYSVSCSLPERRGSISVSLHLFLILIICIFFFSLLISLYNEPTFGFVDISVFFIFLWFIVALYYFPTRIFLGVYYMYQTYNVSWCYNAVFACHLVGIISDIPGNFFLTYGYLEACCLISQHMGTFWLLASD